MSEYITPPAGWYDFGTFIDPLKPGEVLIFSDQMDDLNEFPLWEQVVTLTAEDYIAMYAIIQESALTRVQKLWLASQVSRGRKDV